MHIAAQYDRAPFPDRRYWQDDLKQMGDGGGRLCSFTPFEWGIAVLASPREGR